MKNMRNIVDIRLANNKIGYLEWKSKSSFITQMISDNELAVIHKIKTTSTLNKSAYFGICILELSKVQM